MARLTQLADGRWFVQWYDARRRRRSRRVPDRAAGRELKRDVECALVRERLGLAEARPLEAPSLVELVTMWRAHVVTHRRPRTWESYELGLRDVLGWLTEHGRPPEEAADLTVADMTAYAAQKLHKGAGERTVDMRVGALRTMLAWAVQQGHLRANPLAGWDALAKRAQPRRQRGALTEFEMAALLRASPPELADVWRFVLGTGLRTGELTAMEWEDVDWQAPAVRVRAETSKSRRERSVPLRDDLVAVLRRQRQRQAGAGYETRLLFPNGAGRPWGNLSRRLKPCLAAAGLAQSIDVHTLRHTFASHLVAAGVDVATLQTLLGHSSAMVTLNVYAHAFPDNRAAAVQAMPLPPMSAATARRQRAAGGRA